MFFFNDIVTKSENIETTKYGLVRNNQEGSLKVLWYPEGRLETTNKNELSLRNRYFNLGQEVKNVNAELGVVKDIKMRLKVKVLNSGELLDNVSAADLIPVDNVPSASKILFKGWIGSVIQVTKRIRLDFGDGSKCSINLKEIQNFIGNFFRSDYLVYPGQIISAPWFTLRTARWDTGSPEALFRQQDNLSMFNATIADIQVVSYNVEWIYPLSDSNNVTEDTQAQPSFTSVFATDVETVNTPDHYRIWLGNIRGMKTPTGIVYVECIDIITTLEIEWKENGEVSHVRSIDVFPVENSGSNGLPYGYVINSITSGQGHSSALAGSSAVASNGSGNVTHVHDLPPPRFPAKFYKFSLLTSAATSHAFYNNATTHENNLGFANSVQREIHLLQNTLPSGIWVKGYEDRMDLLSILIEGPEKTPYEDMTFVFEVMLPANYPNSPPTFKYISFTQDYCNPNLYQNGKVCVSLLGTWEGDSVEKWDASKSNILQVLTSIQGLILVPEPYYNEPGYEAERNTAHGLQESTKYNQMVIHNMVLAAQKMLNNPPFPWEKEMVNIIGYRVPKLVKRIKSWLLNSSQPSYPLLPFSEQYKSSLNSELERLENMYVTFAEVNQEK